MFLQSPWPMFLYSLVLTVTANPSGLLSSTFMPKAGTYHSSFFLKFHFLFLEKACPAQYPISQPMPNNRL